MKPFVVTRGSRIDLATRLALLAGVLVVAFSIPYQFGAYRVFQFSLVIVYAVAVLGLNLLTGYNGQISLGHSAFFAAGAYASAILIDRYEWNYLLTIPVAAAFTFALGYLFGIPALRLQGLYLALVTLALGVVAPNIIKKFDEFTKGTQGIVLPGVQAPEWSGLANDQWVYLVCLVVALLLFLLAANLTRGRVGRAMVSIRDNHIAAETMGIDIASVKTRTFAYSAMYAGIAGSLYTFVVAFVAPESFTVALAISFLAGMVVGGLATISGAVFGGLFIQFVPVWASEVNKALAGVIYGVALIVFMFVMPGGVLGLFRRLRARVVRYQSPPASAGGDAPPSDEELVSSPVGRPSNGGMSVDERGSA